MKIEVFVDKKSTAQASAKAFAVAPAGRMFSAIHLSRVGFLPKWAAHKLQAIWMLPHASLVGS